MRKFKRRFSSFGKRKKPVSWVVGSGYNPGLVNGQLVVNAGAVAGPARYCELVGIGSAVTTYDPPSISRFLVKTIKGEILVVGRNLAANEGYIVSLGLAVVDVSTSVPTGATLDPLNANDADYSWIWLKQLIVNSSTAGMTPNFTTGMDAIAYVSSKSKRVLTNNQRLYLFANALQYGTTTVPTGNVYVNPFLRTLISNVA